MTNYEALVREANAHSDAPNPDPTLPEQIRQRVIEVAEQLALQRGHSSSQDFWTRVGQANNDTKIAEEIVLADLLPPASDQEPDGGDAPLPPDLPADPAHPLNDPELVEQMSDQEYRSLYEQWQATPEYQQPAAQAAAWERRRHDG